jgi:hypothetical protein
MKLYSHLPKEIKLPTGETLKVRITADSERAIIYQCKVWKCKYRCISVLATNLRGKTDLHGQPYKPSKWIFTNLEN